MSKTPEDISLSKAKVALVMRKDAVFLATIVMSLKTFWDNSIPTACTDGLELRFNTDFWNDQNPLQKIGLLAHEAWHVAFQHVMPHRLGKRDLKVFNEAADHAINLMLLDQGYHLPKGGLADPAYRGKSAEEIYDILMANPQKQDPNFVPDFSMAGGNGNSQSPAQQAAAQAAVTSTLVRAATAAKMAGAQAGEVPGGILIALDELLYPKLPWSVLLEDFFNGVAQEDYSYAKPNRKYLPDLIMPTLYSEGMGTIACAVDTSGSVSDHDFLAFITEMQCIKDNLMPEEMYVVDFDTKINNVHKIVDDMSLKTMAFTGRGGTDLRPVFEHFKKTPPQVLVVFSDLECSEITEKPDYPVLWIRTPGSGHTPTFGRLIEFNP